MKTISDEKKIKDYLERFHIRDAFQTRDLHFILQKYEKGEFITAPYLPLTHIQFLTEGYAQIYHIQPNGDKTPVNLITPPDFLGDIEFVTSEPPNFFVETLTEVTCLSLPVERYRTVLNRDITFLHFLLRSLAKKFDTFSKDEVENRTVEERLLFYMNHIYENQTLAHIDSVTAQLRCSRRQIQRVLKKLCDEGVITRKGKGVYRLAKPSPLP